MGFKIKVQNDGDTATVQVWQWINLNEKTELMNEVLESDGTRTINCFTTDDDGDNRGNFEWRHHGSLLTDQETINADDTLTVK